MLQELLFFTQAKIAKKIKLELDRSPDKPQRWGSPEVILKFTGKGSRIMDWLAAINPGAIRATILTYLLKDLVELKKLKSI